MARFIRFAGGILLVTSTTLSTSSTSTQQLLTIGGYVKVSEVRVTRTVTEFVYRATLANAGSALAGATAQASSGSSATTIVDASLTFGSVVPGGTVVSSDTFAFRHDRTVPFDFSNIRWVITPLAGNRPPVANAGADQTVAVSDRVTLDGTGSTDADGDALLYSWSFESVPSGSRATLSDASALMPTFVVDVTGTYRVRLIVNDGRADGASDTVEISTRNSAPVAHAGPDQSAVVTQTIMLDGSASSDVDANPLTFSWTLVQKPGASTTTLTGPTSVHPSFLVDMPGTYIASLVVNDGIVNSAPASVTISTGEFGAGRERRIGSDGRGWRSGRAEREWLLRHRRRSVDLQLVSDCRAGGQYGGAVESARPDSVVRHQHARRLCCPAHCE